MAQGDLIRLLKSAEQDLANAKGFRDILDRESQEYKISYDAVFREVVTQIKSKGIEPSIDQADPLRKACIQFCKDVYSNANTYSKKEGSNAEVILTGTPASFNILIIQSKGKYNLYRIIKVSFLAPAKPKLISRINEILGKKVVDANNLLDIGHKKAVSQYHIEKTFGDLSSKLKEDLVLRQTALQAKLNIVSKFDRYSNKVFEFGIGIIKSGPESTYLNTKKGAEEEKALKVVATKYLTNFIQKHKSWADQEGSDSKIQEITKTLIQEALKKGFKANRPVSRTNKSSNRAEVTIGTKASNNTRRVKADPFIEKKDIASVEARKPLINLLALLNAKLPQAVKANMTGARLHNKTGRFAESVKAVSVVPTPQGFPSIGYTYQRSPYDVFDPALGARPWNTKERDPKSLIDLSIRDIARELAIGRFYTRRV